MRKVVLAISAIVVALALALGWMEAERSRSIDPPEPIARAHGSAIAAPILAAARTKGWRRETRARVPLVTSEGDEVVYRRFPIEDRSGECVGVVAMAAGQVAIQELRLSTGPRSTRPELWYWEGARRSQLVMTDAACHRRPLGRGDILRAMTGAWSGPCSPYDDCPGPNELVVRARILGTGRAPRRGTLEVVFLRISAEEHPASLPQGPGLDPSLVRVGPRTASVRRGVVRGAQTLALGGLLSFFVLGAVALARRALARPAVSLSVRRVTLVFSGARRTEIMDAWRDAKTNGATVDALRAFRDALASRASEAHAVELECFADRDRKARERMSALVERSRAQGSEGYRGDASWFLVTIVVLHSTELLAFEDPFSIGGLTRALSMTIPIDDADVLEWHVLFGSAGDDELESLLVGCAEIEDSAAPARPCQACGLVIAAGSLCPRCERRGAPARSPQVG